MDDPKLDLTRFLLICLVLLQFSTGCGGGSANSGGPPPPPPPPPNPTPAIVSLTPASANAGNTAFTLTITGYNFLASSSVQWNGSARTTTYTSSTQLQAQITADDIANAGTALVNVISPSPGGGNSGSAEFTISAASNPVPSLTAFNPTSIDSGSSDFILTLYGANFVPEATIVWNGAALPTSYLSDSYLEAHIPATNVTSSGFAEVWVSNPSPGGGTSSPLFFAINYHPTVVSQLANDMVWDSNRRIVYLSVPSLASSNGNTIAIFDPASGTIQSSQFAGSEPDVLALSSDDQFLYAGIDGASSVQRFTLPDLVPDLKYPLGAHSFLGPYFAVDLGVAPGLSHTSAVSRGVFNVTPYGSGGIAVYDDAVKRSKVATSLFDSLQWGSDTNIYAINSESSSFDFFVLAANSGGVTISKDYINEFSSFYARMHYNTANHLVYTDDGYVINPANGQHVGVFPAAGYMVPDSSLNKAFFFGQTQSQFGSNSFTVESFNLTTFAPIAEIVLPNIQGYPLRFIRWGASGLALNDDAGYIYIINDAFVSGSPAQAKTPQRYLYPVEKHWSAPKIRPQDRVKTVRANFYSLRPLSSSQDSNPAPTVTALSPDAVALNATGINGFTLTVTGSNFVSLSTVEWNGIPLQTEFVSSTELQAQVGIGDVQNPGSVSITVKTPSPGGGTSNALNFAIVNQTPVHAPVVVAVNPNYAVAGSSGLTISVHTNWLTSASVVYWNGSPRPTSINGDPQIQLNASDIATPGYAQVSVFTPGAGMSNAAEFQILYQPVTVNQSINDMIWDPVNQTVYISVPSSASTNANQVCVLNPVTAAITNCHSGSEPDVLALSDDSQFLYVGMDGSNSVQRYILPSLTPDISYTLGNWQNGAPYYALDLQVQPGAPHTTAVSKGVQNLEPGAVGGITIFDDATPRPTSVPGDFQLYDSIQWSSDGTALYAANSESTGFDFYTLAVNSSGVTLDQDYSGVFWNPGRIHFNSANGFLYSDDGFHVIDPSTGLPAGIFEGGGPMVPDSSVNTAFILAKYVWQEIQNYTIDSFDMTHYTPITRTPFSTSETTFNRLGRFIRWGSEGLALNFKGGNIYLISSSFVSAPVRENRTRHDLQ